MLKLFRYGRLSLEGVVLSKRKLKALIEGGHVRGWDDPRLYTLIALRRRGIPPGALLSFVNELGVSKAPGVLQIKRFEQSIRKYLEQTVPRLMLILDPLEVVIEDLPDEHVEIVDVPFAKDPAYGVSHPHTPTIDVDRMVWQAISMGCRLTSFTLDSPSTLYENRVHRTIRLSRGRLKGLLPHGARESSRPVESSFSCQGYSLRQRRDYRFSDKSLRFLSASR